MGTQYRSAVFYGSPEQRRIAEDYHQDYLEKNPGGYCHVDLGLLKKTLE